MKCVSILMILILTLQVSSGSFYELMNQFEDEEEKKCEPYSHHDISRCEYVKTDACSDVQDGGFIDYLNIYFCTGGPEWLWAMLYAYALINVFIVLGEVADEFFAPTMKEMSDTLGVSETVSGVTFMAIGNGAPDISASIDALTGSQPKLGMAALLGAGVFVPVVVSAAVAISVPGSKIARRPYIRDVLFLFCGVGYIIYIVFDKKITEPEAFSLWIFYALYVLSVFLGEIYRIKMERLKHDEEIGGGQPEHQSKAISVLTLFSQESMVDVFGNQNQKQINDKRFQGYQELDEDGAEDDPKTIYEWIYLITSAPAQIVMCVCRITCPTFQDYETNGWNSKLAVLHTLSSPAFVVIAFQPLFQLQVTISNTSFSVIWVFLLVSLLPLSYVSYQVWSIANWRPQKITKVYFLFLSFFASVAWIYVIANELVNLLSVFGVLLSIKHSILGLTVLAWGNSVGDLVANVAVAKEGKPAMAMSACFGGPLLNILIGTGASMTINTINGKEAFPRSSEIFVCGFGIMVACIMHIICVAFISRFTLTKSFGFICLVFYVLFMGVNICAGVNLF